MHMQKIRDGPGRSRELWPNVRYADTLPVVRKFLQLGFKKFHQSTASNRVYFHGITIVFRHRKAFKPQPEITWIVQILSKKLRHSLFYVFWLNIGLRAY